jgi:hypothetical protein
MSKNVETKWLHDVEEHDYPAAKSYLSLVYDDAAVKSLVNNLRRAPITEFKAKDIFRASGLSLLGVSNSHVDRDRKKLKEGRALSPLLLVRHTALGKVVIADGYHRLCAVYGYDEDAVIPCKIV